MKFRELKEKFADVFPEQELLYLVSGLLECSIIDLQSLPEKEISDSLQEKLSALIQRRRKREPLQYLLGVAPFRDLMLKVTPAVLIPRPETEELVDLLLAGLPQGGTLLDLGTGSGAIALAAAFERNDAVVTAADISPAALEIARENARKCGVASRVEFCCSDLFSALPGRKFHCIAANLPYVTDEEYPGLEPELFFEPRLALTAPDAGFSLIEKTARALSDHLLPEGKAFFELSPPQAPRLEALGKSLGFRCSIHRDLAGRDRFVRLTR